MITLFRETSIDAMFNTIFGKILNRINNLSDNQILQQDISQISKEIANRYKIQPLEINLEDREVNVEMIDMLPPGTHVRGNYPCARVNYTFTVNSGDVELLCIQPKNARLNKNIGIIVKGNRFTIGYQTKYANTDLSEPVRKEVKQGMKENIASIEPVIEAMNNEIMEFNMSLESQIIDVISAKKKELQKKQDIKNDLNTL